MSDSTTEPGSADAPGRRILFITGRLESSAPSRLIVGLAREFGRAGYEAQIVCRGGSLAKVYPSNGAARPTTDDPPIWISRALDQNLRGYLSLRGLVRQVREIDPDVLYVHGSRLARLGARLARRVRRPYLLAIGDFLDPGRSVSRSRRFLRRILVASDAVRIDLVNRIGLPRGLIAVVPDGVDLPLYPAREPGLTGFGMPVVGAIGRLVESKGHDYLIRAAHLLAMRGRHMQFVIAGGGPDRKRLQNLVWELDLGDRITFAREPVDQLQVLKALDILAVPAPREALGLSVIEAMACGIPVVATSAGGVFSLIENGKTGILVPKKDPDALASQLERVLDDPELAAELARKGRERVAAQFGIEAAARRAMDVYEKSTSDDADDTTAAS